MATIQKLENKPYIPSNWESVNCPLCNSKKFKRYERFGDKWQYTYVLCEECKLVYQNPRPIYDDSFVHSAYDHYIFEIESRIRRDRIKFYETEKVRFQSDIKTILEFDKKRTAFLDVGCDVGILLYSAKPFFKTVNGLEVSAASANIVKEMLNVDVFTDKFENVQPPIKYSCISMSHVIEHIPNPNEWLAKAKTILDDDGILVVSVPNMFSLARKVKLFFKNIGLHKGKWESWRTPDHLYEPTLESFQKFFKNNKFEILDSYSYSKKSKYLFAKLIHRKLYWGSNLRFVVKPIK
jgi:2-polyprenyl-3-methyl-5-hydroxy-6-metoxy-1,4-benzoquinol methylase